MKQARLRIRKLEKNEEWIRVVSGEPVRGMAEKCSCIFGMSAIPGGQILARAYMGEASVFGSASFLLSHDKLNPNSD